MAGSGVPQFFGHKICRGENSLTLERKDSLDVYIIEHVWCVVDTGKEKFDREDSVYFVEKDDRPEDTTNDRKSNLKLRGVKNACQGIDSFLGLPRSFIA